MSLRAAVVAFEAAGDLRNACSLKKTQGWYAAECGALEEGERVLTEAIAVASRMGLTSLSAHAKHDIGSPLVRLGKLDLAARYQAEAIEAFQAQGDRRLESYAHGYLSWIQRLRGDAAGAEREARLAIDLAPSAPVRVGGVSFLAAALLAGGRVEASLDAAREGLALLDACGGSEEGVALLHLTRAQALHALGRPDEARAAIAIARDGVLERASRIGDPALRATFMSRIAENAETLDLASAWLPTS